MEGPAQLATLQLLLFLLPPCHSDTLHRLLQFLSEVARHAESSRGPDGQEVRLARTSPPRHGGLTQTLLGKSKQSFSRTWLGPWQERRAEEAPCPGLLPSSCGCSNLPEIWLAVRRWHFL